MNNRRKKRMMLSLALVVGIGLASSLILYALRQNIDLFYTPSQLLDQTAENQPTIGQRLRIGGLVVPGTLQRASDSLKVSFKLVDDFGGMVTIDYEGILPDLFREGQGIVAQGTLAERDRVQASEVLAKHDEEYMPPEVAEVTQRVHQKPTYTKEQLEGSQQ